MVAMVGEVCAFSGEMTASLAAESGLWRGQSTALSAGVREEVWRGEASYQGGVISVERVWDPST